MSWGPMLYEWMTVKSDNSGELWLLIPPPCNATGRLPPDSNDPSNCPSVVTFSQPIPRWLDLGEQYNIDQPSIYSAKIKRISPTEEFELWASFLNLPSVASPLEVKRPPTLEQIPESRGLSKIKLGITDPLKFIRKISFVMSDVIVISGHEMEDVADQFLDWVHDCQGLVANKRLRPHACIIALQATSERNLKEYFQSICLQSNRAQQLDRSELDSVFEDYSVLAIKNLEQYETDFRTRMRDYVLIGRRMRRHSQYLWSQRTFHKLHVIASERLARTPAHDLNVVRLLGPWFSVQAASRTLWPEWESAIQLLAESRGDSAYDFAIEVMGSAFARNALKDDHVFNASDLFDSIYGKLVSAMAFCQHKYERLKKTMIDYVRLYACGPNLLHIDRMTSFRPHWVKTFSPRLCLLCLVSQSAIPLPCGHTLCKKCFRDYVDRESVPTTLYTTTGLRKCDKCLFCSAQLRNFGIVLHSPCSSPRWLFLDGGGIRIKVLLSVSSILYKEIDLGIPFHDLFNGIIGTSAGGIVAILLGMKGWSLSRCNKKLDKLADTVFPDTMWNWFNIWRKGWDLARNRGIFDESKLENILRHFIGEGTPMLGKQAGAQIINVGVITASTEQGAELMTNYPAIRHNAEIPWAQKNDVRGELKAWEAARCTAGAPMLFSFKRIRGKCFYDGGAFHNYPGEVGMAEAQNLNPHGPRPVFVSVGCGLYNKNEKPIQKWWDIAYQSFSRKLNASQKAEEHCNKHPFIHRLDLPLDMEEPLLSNASALPQLQKNVEAAQITNSSFKVHKVQPCALHLVASLFYFELETDPIDFYCSGKIDIQFQHLDGLQEKLLSRFNTAWFLVGTEKYHFEIPCYLKFTLENFHEDFRIYLVYGDHRAPIFECLSLAEIYDLQQDCLRGRLTERGEPPLKRLKLTHE